MNLQEEEVLVRPMIHQDIIDGLVDDEEAVEKRLEYDMLVPPPIKYFSRYLYEVGDQRIVGDDGRDMGLLDEQGEGADAVFYADVEEEVRRRLREEGYDSEDPGEMSDDSELGDEDGVVPLVQQEEQEEGNGDDDSDRYSVNSNAYQPDSDDEPIVDGVPLTEEDKALFERERGTHVYATNFHPEHDWVAMATVTGEVAVYEYSHKGNILVTSMRHHGEAVRDLCFSDKGDLLFTVSADRSIKAIRCKDWELMWTIDEAHGASINRLIVCDNQTLATGDDDGIIKVWDLRWKQRLCIATFEEHADYISGFDYNPDMSQLYATSGDGSISVYNIRTKKCIDVSENKHYDFTSVCEMKNGYYIVAGTSSGDIALFKHGAWANPIDSIKTTHGAVECMCFLTEDLVAVGFADGRVRTYSILPNRLVTVSAIHHEQVPVSHVSLARDGKYIATSGDDCFVKFWSVYHLLHRRLEDIVDENGNFKSEEVLEREEEERHKAREEAMRKKMEESDDDSDMDDSDDDSGDDSDEDNDDSSDKDDDSGIAMKKKPIGPKRKKNVKKDDMLKRKLIEEDSDAELLASSDDNDSDEDRNEKEENAKENPKSNGNDMENGDKESETEDNVIIQPSIKSQPQKRQPTASQPPKKKKRTFNSTRKAFFSGLM